MSTRSKRSRHNDEDTEDDEEQTETKNQAATNNPGKSARPPQPAKNLKKTMRPPKPKPTMKELCREWNKSARIGFASEMAQGWIKKTVKREMLKTRFCESLNQE